MSNDKIELENGMYFQGGVLIEPPGHHMQEVMWIGSDGHVHTPRGRSEQNFMLHLEQIGRIPDGEVRLTELGWFRREGDDFYQVDPPVEDN